MQMFPVFICLLHANMALISTESNITEHGVPAL